jgi:class 3 adenylate cyclase
MNRARTILLFLIAFFRLAELHSQEPNWKDSVLNIENTTAKDSNRVNRILQLARWTMANAEDVNSALPVAGKALSLANEIGDQRGMAQAYKLIGIIYYNNTKYPEALDYWNKSKAVFESLNDKSGIANMQNNIGSIYKDQGADDKALENFFGALQNSELKKDSNKIFISLNNIGSVYQHKPATYEMALGYYLKAMQLRRHITNPDQLGTILSNIGEIYLSRKETDSALYYFEQSKQAYLGTGNIAYAINNEAKTYAQQGDNQKAIEVFRIAYDSAEQAGSPLLMTQSLLNEGDVFYQLKDYRAALDAYQRAEKMATENKLNYELKGIYEGLSRTYAITRQYDKAYRYKDMAGAIKDTIYNNELDQKLSNYTFNFEMQKKQGQIDLLEKDKALQDLNIKRQKLAKNAVMAGLGLILVIAGILFRDYRAKIRVNKLLDSQNMQIEGLLRNILPDEVAKELQHDGQSKPRYFESVTVLFTDFKGFSAIAETLSPQDVVAELSDCFVAFDNIMEKYGLEKIKTIGDSYMCAGGIPIENTTHPLDMVKAAFEIIAYMKEKNMERQKKTGNNTPWDLRVGVHTGPVVAGVVGKKKYAYDIWGSTVNIASRMESNGEPGRINISEATYMLIKDQYPCSYRGKIYAKNVGEIDMYFVENPA